MPSYYEWWIVNTDFQPTTSPRSEDECVHGPLHDRYEVPAPALRGPAPAARGEVQRGQGHGDMHQVQYSAVQYSIVQYSQYSTVQYSTVQYSVARDMETCIRYSAVQHSTVQYSAVQYSTVQHTHNTLSRCLGRSALSEESLLCQ